MLEITSIKRGIVIDHINQGSAYKIFKLLKLDNADFPVALIMNVSSKKLGRKDLIKIENVIDVNLGILGLFGEDVTVNIINNEMITQKLNVYLPERIEGILECKNPRCITHHERNVKASFQLLNKKKRQYICDYCDHLYDMEEIK